MPLSQSVPAAHTQPPATEVLRPTVGAPLGPLVSAVFAMTALAALNAATLILPSKPDTYGTALILAPVTFDEA